MVKMVHGCGDVDGENGDGSSKDGIGNDDCGNGCHGDSNNVSGYDCR